MKDRLITLAGALAALALVYGLFFRRPAEPPATRPLSVEAGPNGYLALRSWLEHEGVAVESLRERFNRLREDPRFPAKGNLLISTMPGSTAIRGSELAPLSQWVRDGNTLLILAALDDSPDWLAAASGLDFTRDLPLLTGLTFVDSRGNVLGVAGPPAPGAGAGGADAGRSDGAGAPSDRARSRFGPPPVSANTAVEIVPAVEHPLLRDVKTLRGFSDQPSEIWSATLRPGSSNAKLVIGNEASTRNGALWEMQSREGRIVLVASGSLLANRNIGEADNRYFVRNLLRYHLAPNGVVIFDDMHQGLSSLYDAAALFNDSRFKATLWFVLGAWLVYVVGASNRLAPPRAERNEPRQRDFLAAAGGFMARRLDRRETGLLLLEEWFAEVRRRRGEHASTAPPWAALEATPTLSGRTYRRLRDYHERLTAGEPVDLVGLHNTLKQAREAIG